MICPDDVHCFSMSILSSSYRGDICCLVDEKKMGKTVIRTKYWVCPYFNKSDELCSFVAAWELDLDHENLVSFLRDDKGSFKFCPFLNNQDVSSHTKWCSPASSIFIFGS